MPKTILANAFSLSMLPLPLDQSKWYHLKVTPLSPTLFCSYLKTRANTRDFLNAIGHQATAQLINQLCDVNIEANRIQVTLNPNDELLLIQILERLPEGRILSAEELLKMLNENKIRFYHVYYSEYYVD